MALTLNANWLAEAEKGSDPVFLVTIGIDGSTAYKFLSSDNTALGYNPSIATVTPVAGKIDPFTRKYRAGSVEIQFVDDGVVASASGANDLRSIVKNHRVRGKRVIVELGFENLAEGDYEPYFRGTVDDVRAAKGGIIVKTDDIFRQLKQVTMPTKVSPQERTQWKNQHPIEIIEDILNGASIPSELINSTSLDPDQYSGSISHWATHRSFWGEVDLSITREIEAGKVIEQLSELMHGGVWVDENGKLTFSRFDASAAAQDNWTADDFDGLVIEEAVAKPINRGIVEFGFNPHDDEYTTKMVHGNTDSQTNYAYPGESEQLFTQVFSTDWVNSTCFLGADVAAGDSTVTLYGGHLDSFCGMRDDGSTHWASSSTRKVYLLLIHPDLQTEVIECTTAALDATVFNSDGKTAKVVFTVNTNGRKYTETPAATGYAFDKDRTIVWDVTIVVDWLRSIIERRSEGAPIVKVRTSLAKYATQLNDLVTLDFTNALSDAGDFFLTYNKSGLSGSDKWEAISKEVDAQGGPPGITWTFAKAASTTGYTEEWEPGDSAGNGLVIPGILTRILGSLDPSTIYDNFIDFGMTVTSPSGFNVDIASGLAMRGTVMPRHSPATDSTSHAMTASKDTWVRYCSMSHRYEFHEVALGAAEPALTPTQTRLAQVVTDGSSVTTISDIRPQARMLPSLESMAGANMTNPNAAMSLHTRPASNYLPDGYEIVTGTLGTDVDITTSTTNTTSGERAISLDFSATTPVVATSLIPLFDGAGRASRTYRIRAMYQASATATHPQVEIQWIKADRFTIISTSTATQTPAATTSPEILAMLTSAPALTRYGRLRFTNSAGTGVLYLDSMWIEEQQHAFALDGTGGDQSIGASNSYFFPNLNNQIYDYGSWATVYAAIGPIQHSATIPENGLYQFTGSVRFSGLASGDRCRVVLYKNSAFHRSGGLVEAPSATGDLTLTISVTDEFAFGDVVQLAFQNIDGAGGSGYTVFSSASGFTYLHGNKLE